LAIKLKLPLTVIYPFELLTVTETALVVRLDLSVSSNVTELGVLLGIILKLWAPVDVVNIIIL
jgi:hypothetical protein